jgi:opacity protein-like surface antigen
VDFTADYNYWHAPSVDLTDAAGAEVTTDHAIHAVLLGLRYQFGQSTRQLAERVQGSRGTYVSVGAGAAFGHDGNILGSETNFDAFDLGPAGTVAVGHGFTNGVRVELEFASRKSGVDILDFGNAGGESRARGDLRTLSLIANLLYDFDVVWPLRPFVGAGIGFARREFDVEQGGATFVDDRARSLAWQGVAGIGVDLTSKLAFTAQYQYWGTLGRLSFEDASGSDFETFQSVHTFMLGLRFTLGT